MNKNNEWAENTLPHHNRLTESVVIILDNLLKSKNIEHLSVSGRTKSKKSVLEKINRKKYKDPSKQMTDISGIRIIVFFESDIKKTIETIEEAFNVDIENSLNQDDRMSVDQIGYRSVHYVCDLGDVRSQLPEYSGLINLKFEIQIRTVLQHAWAELAHDRNYKFSEKLPPEIERSLYLYAGMLEIADKGFSDLSNKIDLYIKDVHSKTIKGNLSYVLDSLSLREFFDDWIKRNKLKTNNSFIVSDVSDLIYELNTLGINTAEQLNDIIPAEYAKTSKKREYISTIFGTIRDWMIIHDWRAFVDKVKFNWVMSEEHIFDEFFDEVEFEEFKKSFSWENDYD